MAVMTSEATQRAAATKELVYLELRAQRLGEWAGRLGVGSVHEVRAARGAVQEALEGASAAVRSNRVSWEVKEQVSRLQGLIEGAEWQVRKRRTRDGPGPSAYRSIQNGIKRQRLA